MDITKARKQGNSLMIVLNKKLGVEEGQEFYVIQEKNGVIELIPKMKDIYQNVIEGAYAHDELEELARVYQPLGSELDD
ncbi:hypothetical protein A5823_002823 [Enterococcus faecalis]|uniref:type II toxin-antitoxin system PemI/MazE family antitoxin n=1 Tax=Enterococcus faecalis TaxID=1351 RepID=UPI000A33CC99|nr:AbrB/MazE/SpoVT family DNA-binding domain-containing protein [Enterococcus faecalis]OTP25067.1 hypothetical protein A5823_002823 [Enterococcus faecalis]